jgi:hypothetical protein
MSSILRIVMAASVANCNRIEKDDGIELWTSQKTITRKKQEAQPE